LIQEGHVENSQSATKVSFQSFMQIRKSKGKRFSKLELAICEIAITILTVGVIGHVASDWNFADLHIGGVNRAWCGNSRYAISRNDLSRRIEG
jgi:hypothetical protein